MFNPSELGSKDLSDYKNSKAYSYYKSSWIQPLMYHNLTRSNYCIFKSECRRSQSINDTYHKLWLVLEKSAKIKACHCTCMAGMGQTCNHVASAMYRVEAAVRNGLANPACTSTSNEWLPSRKEVAPSKIKDLDFSREDFGERGKKKRKLVDIQKEKYNPLSNNTVQLLNINDVASALENIVPTSILFTAVPKPKIDFIREVLTNIDMPPVDLPSIDSLISTSSCCSEFFTSLKVNMSAEIIKRIELVTRGQNENENWYHYRKSVITASKAHEVATNMDKVKKTVGGYHNFWSLNQKISGLTFTNPNIPALKYGRTMEVEAVNAFYEKMKGHKNLTLNECGLYLDYEHPYIGASPDRIMSCVCCPKACIDVKCPYKINFTTPTELNLPYLIKEGVNVKLKTNHTYYTQCMLQMAVTRCSVTHFVVWTPHGIVVDKINFDVSLWNLLKEKYINYYKDYFLKSIFST